jgi:Raf kinase inhibitor-like YbhB/YbcL family protein
MAFVLSSPAFGAGQAIPVKYTCDGENVSPPLQWSGPPAGTQSYVLIVEDPDAPSGMFRHWAVYNLASDRTGFPENAGRSERLNEGINDFGHARYDGPCPPPGHGTHHYHFHLAALDTPRLTLSPKAKVAEIWRAAQPHALAQADLVGTYRR